MNLFQNVKYGVNCREAVERYGIGVDRYGKALGPFHNDRHPSLYVADDHYYCFVCGAHGGVIDFAANFFALPLYEAAQRLTADFGIDTDSPPTKEVLKKRRQQTEAQERLKLEIETTEEWVEQRQAMGNDLDAFIALTKKYVDVTELTQTIVNEYIKKIIIHAPDKSGGKRRQKVEIIFNFVDEVEIPVLAEPMIAESTLGRRKTA